jgi:hypothetical protein
MQELEIMRLNKTLTELLGTIEVCLNKIQEVELVIEKITGQET